MCAFKTPVLVALAAAAALLAVPGAALANGGDIHFGAMATGIPVVIGGSFGAFAGLVVLFFVANWARYKRAQSRGGPPPRPRAPQRREEEEDDGTG